jgi:hypothetical protein
MLLGSISVRALRALTVTFLTLSLLLGAALAGTWIFFSRKFLGQPIPELTTTTTPGIDAKSAPISPLLLNHQLDLPGRGEIFPALVASGATDYWPLAILTVSNNSDRPVLETVTAEIPDWSRPQVQTIVIGPRETRSLHIIPELLPQAYQNDEIRRAVLRIRAGTDTAETTFAQSRAVFLHGAGDIYWGQKFSNAQYVARWVTPHDSEVLELIAEAKRWVPNGRFTGYRPNNNPTPAQLNAHVRRQANAIFQAMKGSGISYVNSVFTFGNYVGQAQRIRLPRETLALSSANCMDVSVVFASAIENLGMNPILVIVPGHAFTGIKLGPQSSEILYLDLTVLPKGSFEQAVARAQIWLKKTPPDQVLTVDVAAARMLHIYPIPSFAASPGTTNVAESAPVREENASTPTR